MSSLKMPIHSRAPSRRSSVVPNKEKLPEPPKRHKKQLPENLTAAELDEEVVRKLESTDVLAAKSQVQFSFLSGEYEASTAVSSVSNLYFIQSGSVLQSTAESLDPDDFFDMGDASSDAVKPVYSSEQRVKKIRNAFNFCEEAVQTRRLLYRHAEVQTEPIIIKNAAGSVTASDIYDSYVADLKGKQAREMNRKFSIGNVVLDDIFVHREDMLIVMERAISQNIYDSINYDYLSYEDPADDYRTDGSLLPLWHFSMLGQNIPVTAIAWSRAYPYIVAATFGYFEFEDRNKAGAVTMFSIKSPLHPEYLKITPSAALCLSLHTKFPSLLVVGLLNGHVLVYDSAYPKQASQFKSNSENKHVDSVSVVLWSTDDEYIFYSAGADGRVKEWQLSKFFMRAIVIRTVVHPFIGNPGAMRPLIYGSASWFAMHPADKQVYFLGNLIGRVLKCSMLLKTSNISSFVAHRLPVLRIAFSPFNPNIFLTCSSDWTVKLWEDGRTDYLMMFDLDWCVTDCDWAIDTSTVFSAITSDGYVHVFDLHKDRYRPIYKQRAVTSLSYNEPTRLAFHPNQPVIAIGDKIGKISAFKLSPNLRVPAKASRKDTVDQRTLEIRKLDKVLSFVMPQIVKYPEDTPSVVE